MTQTTERCKKVNYGMTNTDACCWLCEHSRVAKYLPTGEKFVCDALRIQTYKNCTCTLFRARIAKPTMESSSAFMIEFKKDVKE